MEWLATLFEKNPELPVFLAVGLGYWIGRFKVRGVGFGPVTGSLLAGVLAFGHVLLALGGTALVWLLH